MSAKTIPYGKQSIDSSDIEAVCQVLASDFLTQGPALKSFEKALRQKFKSQYFSALSHATSGLYVVYRSLGLSLGDLLWTVPNTFVATANAALMCGAQVDFIDIDSQTFNICLKDLEARLDRAKKNNKLPKIVAPVHFAGQPCAMKSIYELAQKYKFFVVEDAAHAVGASYKEQPIGSCTYSDAGVFSFHPVKIITTGEGGAIFVKDEEIHQKAKRFITHGITKDPSQFVRPQEAQPWSYEQLDLSMNFRMTDIQCALGESQLQRLDQNIERRRQLANQYKKAFLNLPIQFQSGDSDTQSSWHLFVLQLPHSQWRKDLFTFMRSKNILVNVHYIPVHTQPYYQRLGFDAQLCPNSLDYYSRALSIPMYHSLSDEDQHFVIEVVEEFCHKFENSVTTHPL